jgi:hypothetical protein
MNKKSFCSFTVCNIAYLHKALSLAESFNKYTSKKLNIYIFDKKRELPDFSNMANILWIEELEIPNIKQLAFKYDITEFSTSLKAYLSLTLFNEYNKVIFFDPDILIYNSIDSIIDLLDKEDIVLTPHYIMPQERGIELYQSDVGMMRFGSFNLGFFALRKSDESLRFLNWWNDRCQDLCYFETQFGLSTDQKWISIAPCFFPTLHISFNMGLNVAFWNIQERNISYQKNTDKFMVNDENELIFFHFSSYNDKEPLLLTKRPFGIDISQEVSLHKLINFYSEISNKYLNLLIKVDKKYSYDYMNNGLFISPTLRRAYSNMLGEFRKDENPFDDKGEIGKFAKKNFLLDIKAKSYIPKGFNEREKYSLTFKFINISLKILLYIIGPTKFSNLSRLLIYLSSYRQIKNLWKK